MTECNLSWCAGLLRTAAPSQQRETASFHLCTRSKSLGITSWAGRQHQTFGHEKKYLLDFFIPYFLPTVEYQHQYKSTVTTRNPPYYRPDTSVAFNLFDKDPIARECVAGVHCAVWSAGRTKMFDPAGRWWRHCCPASIPVVILPHTKPPSQCRNDSEQLNWPLRN